MFARTLSFWAIWETPGFPSKKGCSWARMRSWRPVFFVGLSQCQRHRATGEISSRKSIPLTSCVPMCPLCTRFHRKSRSSTLNNCRLDLWLVKWREATSPTLTVFTKMTLLVWAPRQPTPPSQTGPTATTLTLDTPQKSPRLKGHWVGWRVTHIHILISMVARLSSRGICIRVESHSPLGIVPRFPPFLSS